MLKSMTLQIDSKLHALNKMIQMFLKSLVTI